MDIHQRFKVNKLRLSIKLGLTAAIMMSTLRHAVGGQERIAFRMVARLMQPIGVEARYHRRAAPRF